MARENNGGFVDTVVIGDKVPHFFLHDDIKTNGRLVQKENFGMMDEGSYQFHFHSLSQRQLPDRYFTQIADIQKFRQLFQIFLIFVFAQIIYFLVQSERLDRWKIPPELVFLTHDQTYLLQIPAVSFKWFVI